MVNLFRLLGLPDPNKAQPKPPRTNTTTVDPGPQAGAGFHDFGEEIWSERTEKLTRTAERNVIYQKPDDLHRLQLHGVEHELAQGNMLLVDLGGLAQLPSQKDVCSRRVQELGERFDIPVFSLNDSDSLLMVPGARMRVDTERHKLGMAIWSQLPESESTF